MPQLLYTDRFQHLHQIRESALNAADPEAAVRRFLHLTDNRLHAGPNSLELDAEGRIFLLGIGKAAISMSLAALDILEGRVFAGIATKPSQNSDKEQESAPPFQPLADSIQIVDAGHPLLDEGSIRAGLLAKELLAQTSPEDLVLVLISGGGSALFEIPTEGVSLDDLRRTNHLLIQSGAPIHSINVVRKSLSQSKAGGLARFAAPARVLSLIMSDVVGDQLSIIASGPTVLHNVYPENARETLKIHGLWDHVPKSVREALSKPPPHYPPIRRPINLLIGTNRMVVTAAAKQAEKMGFINRVLNYNMQGEARNVGARFANRLQKSSAQSCYLMGGETTVTVRGEGKGGRNQELVLSAGITMEPGSLLAIMSLASDGIDGPTDAAGAQIDGQFLEQALALGYDPTDNLARNDAYPILEATNSLIRTGLTGTNLNDLVVGLHYIS